MSENVLERLRRFLEDGNFREGDQLPTERQLADKFGVSRRALRDALFLLEAEGKIWRGVGQGTFVGRRELRSPEDIGSILKYTSPAEIMEVRLTLEPKLARFATQRATPSDLAEMNRCLVKGEAAEDYKAYDLWDGRLHRTIAEATHNQLFLALFEALNSVRTQTAWGRARQASLTKERQRKSSDQHRAIVGAIQDRDVVHAESLMREHLEDVRATLLGDY